MNILGFVWSDLGSLIDLDLVILVSFCNMTRREVPRVVWTKFCYCLLLLVLFRILFKSETFKVRLVGIKKDNSSVIQFLWKGEEREFGENFLVCCGIRCSVATCYEGWVVHS